MSYEIRKVFGAQSRAPAGPFPPGDGAKEISLGGAPPGTGQNYYGGEGPPVAG